jgi:hypothetical protein
MQTPIDIDYKTNKPLKYKWWPSISALCFLMLGYWLKMMHLPLADFTIIFSYGAMFGYNLSMYYKLKSKHIGNQIFCIGAIIWTVYLTIGSIFNDGRPFNVKGLLLYLGALIIAYLITLFLTKSND